MLSSFYIFVYSDSAYIIDGNNFICGIYLAFYPLYMNVAYFGHVAYFWHLKGLFVAGTHFAVVWQINVAVHRFFKDMCSNLGSICRL